LQGPIQRQAGTLQSGQLLGELPDFARIHATPAQAQAGKAESTSTGFMCLQGDIAGFLEFQNDHIC
jgi:hypothetical protein